MVTIAAILPVFNGERYVRQAVESVLGQTRPPEEILVVDDGSTDGTAGILASFGDRIRAIRTENRGVASARNAGARAARSTYAAFLDADDAWEAEAIAIDADAARRNPEAVLFFADALAVSADGRPRRVLHRPPGPGPLFDALLRGNVIVTSTAMVRRDVFERIGYFREDFVCKAGVEDWEFFLRCSRAGPFAYIPRTVVRYRIHPAGAVQTHREAMKVDALRVLSLHAEGVPAPLRRAARSRVYFDSGVRHLAAQDLPEARRDFLRSLRTFRSFPRGLAGLAVACSPAPVARFLRRVRAAVHGRAAAP